MYTLVLRHLSRVHLSRANFLYSHDLSDAQLTWNKVSLLGIEGSLAVCLYCRESSYFHTTMLCVLLGGCIRLHFNCDSEVPAVGTGSTSNV